VPIYDPELHHAIASAAKAADVTLADWARASFQLALRNPSMLSLSSLTKENAKARERIRQEKTAAWERETAGRAKRRADAQMAVKTERADAVRRLRESGKTACEIAAELGVDNAEVTRLTKAAGLPPFERKMSAKVRRGLELVAGGMSIQEAAAACGATVEGLRHAVKRAKSMT
jgi:hypothetical protein